MEFEDVHQQFDGHQRLEEKDTKCYKRKRYLVAVLTFFGCLSLSIMRTNLAVLQNDLPDFDEEFHPTRGVIQSSRLFYFLGFLIGPVGAVGVRKFGGAVTFGAGVGFSALLTCFTPTILYWHFSAVWFSQILAGIFQGICNCVPVDVLRLWSIPTERGRLIGIATAALSVENMMISPVRKILAFENRSTPFYVTGVFSLLWCLIWFILVKNTPDEDKLITTREKNYIKQRNACNETEVNYSCCTIFKSKPVWAYLIECFVLSLTGYYLLFYVPRFIMRMIRYDDGEFRIFSNSPFYTYPIGTIGVSFLADYLKNTNKLNISNVYKLYVSLSQIVAIILFKLNVVFWGNAWLIISSDIVLQLIWSFNSVALFVLPVDMGGQYATLIAGFGMVAASLGVNVMALLVTQLTTFLHSFESSEVIDMSFGSWCSIINLFGAFVFYKYGSGDLQPWAVSSGSS